MRILIVTEYFPESLRGEMSGGVEARAFYIASQLARDNDVTVICGRTGNSKAKDVFGNIKVIRPVKHEYSHNASFFSRIRFAVGAYRAAREIKADVVDGYNFISYIPAYFAAKKIGAKKIATYHETWIGEWIKNKGMITGAFGSLWERFVLGLKWDKIISVSEFTKKRLVKRGVSKEKIFVVPNGIDLREYEKVGAEKSKNPTICCVSRLVKTKRVEDLINALQIIKKEIPSIRCKIIGIGDEMDFLRKLAVKNGVEKNVEFIGRVKNHDDVIRAIKSSHVLCHPSILEGFGIAVVEAMACGIPYVCSDIPPLIEVTHNGKGGLIFRRTNSKDLAEKLVGILRDKKLYEQKRKEAFCLAKESEWKELARKVEKIYRK